MISKNALNLMPSFPPQSVETPELISRAAGTEHAHPPGGVRIIGMKMKAKAYLTGIMPNDTLRDVVS